MKRILFAAVAVVISVGAGLAKDTSGNNLYLDTLFGNVDGQSTKLLEFLDVMTSQVVMGVDAPYTQWTHTWKSAAPQDLDAVNPVWDGSAWKTCLTNGNGEVAFNSEMTVANALEALTGSVTFSVGDTDYACTFSRSGTTQYTNVFGFATTSNLTAYVKKPELNGYVGKQELQDYDASYGMKDEITDENQTIAFLNLSNPDPLQIRIPKKGSCKDWLIYVISTTNNEIKLPRSYIVPGLGEQPVCWWLPDEATTNAVEANTPTALYFSQVCGVATNLIFTMGRREFIPLVGETTMQAKFRRMQELKSRSRTYVRRTTIKK